MEKNNQNIEKIDKKVREVLTDLEVPLNANHWNLMNQQLDALDNQETAFDESVRRNMQNSEVPFQPSHWDLMNQRLGKLDNEETAFDESIRQNMQNSEADFQPNHWDLMDQRLEQEFSWKAKVVRYKVIEAAMMLLLLFTAYNMPDSLLENAFGVEFKSEQSPSIISKDLNKPSENKSFDRGTEWRNNMPKQENNKPNATLDKNGVPIVSTDLKENNQVPSSLVFKGNNTEYNILNNQNIVANDFNTLSSENKATNNVEVLMPISLKQANPIAFDFNKEKLDFNKINAPANPIAEVSDLNILRPKALTINALYDDPQLPKMAKRNKWWRLGIFGSQSTDYITSSYVDKGDYNKLADLSFNKGLGVSAIRKKGKFEFGMGFIFNKKSYKTHLPPELISGSIVTGNSTQVVFPEVVNLDIVRIPLSMDYHFKSLGRWNMFATIGAAFNATSKIKIDYYDIPATSTTLQTFGLQTRSASSINQYGKSYKFLSLDKNEGSFYYSAHAGIGVECRVTPLISAYLQPIVEKQFGKYGIGSRNDKINSVSVQVGLKMRISQKEF